MEEYLQGEKSSDILNVIWHLIKFNYDYDRSTSIPILESYWFGEKLYLYTKQSIPSCMSGEKANAEELLKILESRGDCPNAAFYLGIFYEIGLLTSDDNEEAQRHYNISSVQGSHLFTMLEALRPVMLFKEGLMLDGKESLVMNINPMNLEQTHKELLEGLSTEDITDLRFIYLFALCHLTNLGYPLSTAFLITEIVHGWKKEIAQGITIRDIYTKGTSHLCGTWMAKRLIKSAREGNTYAIKALKTINIDYRQNYS